MYSTRTRVHARISNGHPREEKRARRTKVRGQVWWAERAARTAAVVLPRSGARREARRCTPRRLPHEDGRAEVGEEVRVGVGVRLGPVEFKLDRFIITKNAWQSLAYSPLDAIVSSPNEYLWKTLTDHLSA